MLRGDLPLLVQSHCIPYYSKAAGDHSSPIDILSLQDLTDARLALYARCVHKYMYMYHAMYLPKTIVDDWWKISLGRDCRCRLQIQKLDQHAYFILTIPAGNQSITPTFLTLSFLRISPSFSLSTGCGSVSELESGPMVRRKYIDSQLHKEVLYPDRHKHRHQLDRQNRSTTSGTLRRRMSTYTQVLTWLLLANWLSVHTPPPAVSFTPQDVLFCLSVWRALHVVSIQYIHIYLTMLTGRGEARRGRG